jgi:ketosteroid isomerase-like protein
VSIQDDRHIRPAVTALEAKYMGVDGMADLTDFDQVALVVDWLDACRNRDLAALLDLYADDAKLECGCGEAGISQGRAELESYWRPRLETLAPTAFGLEDITPAAERVVLDYLSHEGKPVRIAFAFSRDGKIQRTSCAPAERTPREPAGGVAGHAD